MDIPGRTQRIAHRRIHGHYLMEKRRDQGQARDESVQAGRRTTKSARRRRFRCGGGGGDKIGVFAAMRARSVGRTVDPMGEGWESRDRFIHPGRAARRRVRPSVPPRLFESNRTIPVFRLGQEQARTVPKQGIVAAIGTEREEELSILLGRGGKSPD